MRAAAVVMPLPRRIDGSSLFGRTLETVLAERPCRVIIESPPGSRRPATASRTAGAAPARAPLRPGVDPLRAYDGGVGNAHRQSTRVLAALLVLLGMAMVVSTVVQGGGPLSLGIVLGVPLALLGLGRLYLARADDDSRAGT